MTELRTSWQNAKLVAQTIWEGHRGEAPFPVAFDLGLGRKLDSYQRSFDRNKPAAAREAVRITAEYVGRIQGARGSFPDTRIEPTLIGQLDSINASLGRHL